MSETGDISKLADILHQNGDKVLSALSKLSLNATLLQKLNKSFELFVENDNSNETNKFQVLVGGNANSQLMQDLHFLHDFIQKTVGLKITNNANLCLLDNKVNISKFKSIKYLEIKKVPVKEITGLKVIQSQLESIVCIKCISKLEELLAECGGDNCKGFVWSELKEAVISYNNMKVVDTSIAFAPWLQVLDLSHNQITNVKAIECLPNLKYINLSFNCLSVIPTFNKSARKKMLVLVVKNNYIEDLSGLAGLDHLMELDVSWNWVSNYECLHPLLTMSALQSLSLKGNPINYHRNYKHSVVGYLHISASLSDFVLDGSKLSNSDKAIVGYKLCQPSRSTSASPIESVLNSPFSQTPSTDKGSAGKKSGKVRLAVIPNLDDGTYEEIPPDISAITFKESESMEHLITKKKIEEARATYGSDNWLRCEAGNVVQDILGLPLSETISSTPLDDSCLEAALKSEDNIIRTTAVIENYSDKANDSYATCADDYPSKYYSVDSTNNKLESTECYSKQESESKETSPDFEPIQEPNEEIEDDNGTIYLASRIMKVGNENRSEELFLSLTDLELKEKDSNRGRVINKWSINSLESCSRVQSNKLQLTFDTVKRDKRERTYEMEESEIISLYKTLSQILESRTLLDMNQIAYKCVNCSSQFSKIKNPRKPEANSRCPFCNSTLILEADDQSPSEKEKFEEIKSNEGKKSDVKASHNRSSSASIIQGLFSQASDKVVKCSSHSSIGSAASLDELNELTAIQNTSVKRSDSDIEILSNPSQSSIEVIDPSRMHGGSSPRRKRSSEERQVSQTIVFPENVAQMSSVGGLTESSSSGSVTDSVCTAYENNSGFNPITHKSNIIDVQEAKEVTKMKGKKKTERIVEDKEATENNRIKRMQANLTNKTSNAIQYSYTDFTKIDHRIKLFLYAQIFEDNNEEFHFILRCTALVSNSAKSYPSCVVCSNKKLYILKVTNSEEGDDAASFLQKSNSLRFNLKSLKSICVLTWHQGFSVKLREPHDKLIEVLILLKDQNRTQYFLKFLQSSDLNLPSTCKIITESSQKPILAIQHILVSGASEDTSIRYFCLLNSCSVISYPDLKEAEGASVLTNNTDLLLFSSEPKWLSEGAEQPPKPFSSQKLSNLMSVETENCRIYLQFLNEPEEKEEIWDLTMETPEEVENLIDAIKTPWEEMFSVPLQMSNI